MNKIADIVAQVVMKYDISNEEAEKFVTLMFDVIGECIDRDKLVKVKGLGTFKLTSVSQRESVNVNTGERILLDSRNKISFTPDATLRDRVNSPFAQFETVLLNDGVDFSEIDNDVEISDVAEERLEPAMDEEVKVDTENLEPIAADKPEEHVERVASDASGNAKMSDYELPADIEVQPNDENLSQNKDMEENLLNVDSDEQAKAPVSNNVADGNSEAIAKVINELENMKQQMFKVKDENFAVKNENRKIKNANLAMGVKLKKRKQEIYSLLAVIAFLLVVIVGGFYYFHKSVSMHELQLNTLRADYAALSQRLAADKDNNVSDDIAPSKKEVAKSKPAAKAPVAEQKSAPAPVAKKETTPVVKKEATPVVKKETAQAKPTPAKPSKYDSDPRIRTGAYNIVGVASTVTVRKGQTLASISRQYLGPGMECYMEALNKKELVEGDKVKIPKLELKKKAK